MARRKDRPPKDRAAKEKRRAAKKERGSAKTGRRKGGFALKEAIGRAVMPALVALGFIAYKTRSESPERLVRRLADRVDVIRFVYDSRSRSAVRVEFRAIDDPDDLKRVRLDPETMWRWTGHYVLKPASGSGLWHRLSLVERWFSTERGVKRMADEVARAVPEIDAFLNGGAASPRIAESAAPADAPSGEAAMKPPRRSLTKV